MHLYTRTPRLASAAKECPPSTHPRTPSEHLARTFGQPVVVENKPGAGGNIGVDAVAKAPPDGYTMVITSIGMVTIAICTPS